MLRVACLMDVLHGHFLVVFILFHQVILALLEDYVMSERLLDLYDSISFVESTTCSCLSI